MQASRRTISPESGVKQCSYVLSATSAFSTDDLLMRTRVQVMSKEAQGRKCFGPIAHTCSCWVGAGEHAWPQPELTN